MTTAILFGGFAVLWFVWGLGGVILRWRAAKAEAHERPWEAYFTLRYARGSTRAGKRFANLLDWWFFSGIVAMGLYVAALAIFGSR